MTKMNRRTCQLLVLLLWGISDILQFPRKLPGFFFFYQISYSKTETEGLLSVTGIQTQSSPTLLLPNPVLEDCQTSERHKLFSIFIFSFLEYPFKENRILFKAQNISSVS